MSLADAMMGTLLGALVLVAARWWLFLRNETNKRFHLLTRMGSPEWNISESWASNLTVVGAILVTVLELADLMPDSPKARYVPLSQLFGATVVVAPFVYVATQTLAPAHTPSRTQKLELQGYVLFFLLTNWLTLWAISGQLLVLLLVIREASAAGLLPGPSQPLFVAVPVVGAALAAFYVWQRIESIIRDQAHRERHVAEIKRHMRNFPGADLSDEQIKPPLPRWPVL